MSGLSTVHQNPQRDCKTHQMMQHYAPTMDAEKMSFPFLGRTQAAIQPTWAFLAQFPFPFRTLRQPNADPTFKRMHLPKAPPGFVIGGAQFLSHL